MRWIIFGILLYAAAALQMTHFLSLRPGDCPALEFLPLLAIFYALFAMEDVAPLCGFWCGLALDLITPGVPMGTNAVPLALVALVVVKIRLSVFRENVISQVVVAGLGVLLFAGLSAVWHTILLSGGDASRPSTFWAVFGPLAINALYTGAVAPALFWLLLLLRPILGFEPARGRKR